ncbi:CbrC family protein, partial [Vibrio sp. D406a]
MELPKFKYHPDPIATGVFEKSDDICECCSKAKG